MYLTEKSVSRAEKQTAGKCEEVFRGCLNLNVYIFLLRREFFARDAGGGITHIQRFCAIFDLFILVGQV